MDVYTATEEAYKNGYNDGYKKGLEDEKKEATIEQVMFDCGCEDDECMENE